MSKKRASRSKGTPKNTASSQGSKRTTQNQTEKEEQKVEEALVKVEDVGDPAVKTEEVAGEPQKGEEGTINFPPKMPANVPSFNRDFSPPDDHVPSHQHQGSGDGLGRSSSVSPSLLLSRRPPSLTIDCSGGHSRHGCGDAPLSCDSGISMASPRSRKSPFERYSVASSLALRQRAMSECLPPSPGLRSILKMPSESDMRFFGPHPRQKTVSFSEKFDVVQFGSNNSLDEQRLHAAKNKKKRDKKALRLAKAAQGDA